MSIAGWFLPIALAVPAAAQEVRFAGIVRQGERAIVLLEFPSGPGCRLVGEEECRGVRLVGIQGETVTLLGMEGRFELELADVRMPPQPPLQIETEPAAEPVAAPEPPPAAVADAPRRFSRDDVRLRLPAELPRILSASTVVPRILGSEVAGLELIAFPMDTVLGETGLLPGDVLLRVNGREVRGIESLAVLVQRFQTAEELELLVERRGEPVRLVLNFY